MSKRSCMQYDSECSFNSSFVQPAVDWVDPELCGTRMRYDNPYNYSPSFVFRTQPNAQLKNATYNDRMQQWDWKKYELASEAVRLRGRTFSDLSRDECSKFLSVYYGKPVVCTALAEGCNGSNGYPYWIFWYE